jgi:hypothetical protein
MRRLLIQGSLTLAVAALVIAAHAEDQPKPWQLFARYHENRVKTPPKGAPRAIPHTDERAGYPRELADHLAPSNTDGGIGYYVGGGVPLGHRFGDTRIRRRDEGTWGWDETGMPHFRKRVILGWSHGRRYQGGTGGYAVDGPVVPDPLFATTSIVGSLRKHDKADDH